MKVTVMMAVYNGEKYIGDCIKSIVRQTFSDFELLVIDDGSTDDTRNIIRSFDDPWKSHATLTLLAKQDCPLWLQYD